jgi:hypothetical protein
MKPIRLTCRARLRMAAALISSQLLDLEKWREFNGYGPLPGIKSAEFEVRTPEVVGTRIRVVNRDGSTHVEEITTWEPERRIELRFSDFSKPLSSMADHFLEIWEFEKAGAGTDVTRSMHLFPKTLWSRPILWLISFLLKGALAKHLRDMAA